jgi:hypothetical protein
MRQVLRAHEKVLADQNTSVAQAWRQIFTSLDALALSHETVANAFTGDVSNVRHTPCCPMRQPYITRPSPLCTALAPCGLTSLLKPKHARCTALTHTRARMHHRLRDTGAGQPVEGHGEAAQGAPGRVRGQGRWPPERPRHARQSALTILHLFLSRFSAFFGFVCESDVSADFCRCRC